MSVKIDRAKNVNVRSGGGFAMPVSVSGGGVLILVIVVLAATHQHTAMTIIWGVVFALAIVGAAVAGYGAWSFRNRVTGPKPARQPAVCTCQQHPVPQGHPADQLAPAAWPAALPAARPHVTNQFFGSELSQQAIEALGARRDD